MAERAAEGWLLRTGSRAATSGEIAYLSRIALGAATGLIAMPALLSAFVSPAVAIPVGVALVSSAFLIGAVGGIAWLRGSPDEPAAKATETDQALDIASVCAGAVLFLDPQGSVTGFSGRDRDTFLGWMRDPQGRGFYDQLHVSDRLDFMRAVDSLRQGARDVSVDLRIERAAPLGPAVAEQFVHIRLDMTALAQDGDGALSAIFGQMRDVSDEQALKSDAARIGVRRHCIGALRIIGRLCRTA